jgi:hypothetical protein
MEDRIMQRPSHRGLIIGFLFAFWLGAAALACGPFFSESIGADPAQSASLSPPARPPVVVAHENPPKKKELPPAEMAAAHAHP